MPTNVQTAVWTLSNMDSPTPLAVDYLVRLYTLRPDDEHTLHVLGQIEFRRERDLVLIAWRRLEWIGAEEDPFAADH